MINENRENKSNYDISGNIQHPTTELNKESKFKQCASNQSSKKNLINRLGDGKRQQSVKEQKFS